MRALLQRVRWARVSVNDRVVGAIDRGLLILLGVTQTDDIEVCRRLAKKSAELRIFSDEAGRMNHSLIDVQGQALVVSQFTLYADCRKGRRPSYTRAQEPGSAEGLCEHFVESLGEIGIEVATGRFGADMNVELANDGPVTIWLDSDVLLAPRNAD